MFQIKISCVVLFLATAAYGEHLSIIKNNIAVGQCQLLLEPKDNEVTLLDGIYDPSTPNDTSPIWKVNAMRVENLKITNFHQQGQQNTKYMEITMTIKFDERELEEQRTRLEKYLDPYGDEQNKTYQTTLRCNKDFEFYRKAVIQLGEASQKGLTFDQAYKLWKPKGVRVAAVRVEANKDSSTKLRKNYKKGNRGYISQVGDTTKKHRRQIKVIWDHGKESWTNPENVFEVPSDDKPTEAYEQAFAEFVAVTKENEPEIPVPNPTFGGNPWEMANTSIPPITSIPLPPQEEEKCEDTLDTKFTQAEEKRADKPVTPEAPKVETKSTISPPPQAVEKRADKPTAQAPKVEKKSTIPSPPQAVEKRADKAVKAPKVEKKSTIPPPPPRRTNPACTPQGKGISAKKQAQALRAKKSSPPISVAKAMKLYFKKFPLSKPQAKHVVKFLGENGISLKGGSWKNRGKIEDYLKNMK